jgi:hypothetical protein
MPAERVPTRGVRDREVVANSVRSTVSRLALLESPNCMQTCQIFNVEHSWTCQGDSRRSLAIVLRRPEASVSCVRVAIAAPSGRGGDQMAHRVDLILSSERAGRAGVLCKHQQGLTDFRQAWLIPVGQFKLAGILLTDLDCTLQVVDGVDVLRVIWIDQGTDGHEGVPRAHVLLGERERVRFCGVRDERHIVALIDHHQRHEALAGVGQRDGCRPGGEVEHGKRIERVPVL